MKQIAFDSALAAHALDSLGWKITPSDGVRRNDSHKLEFEILVPASSTTRKRMAVLLQEQLRRVGVSTTIATVEPGVFFARLDKGDFDAALNMWRSVPGPTSLKEVWGTHPKSASAPNFGRYSYAAFDAVLDSASRSYVAGERTALLRRAHQLIVDDAAAIWLYEPRNIAAVGNHIEPVGMRADAWWAEIPDWKISSATVAANKH
jgi:peptide/nickel transport system substrate-binding protein